MKISQFPRRLGRRQSAVGLTLSAALLVFSSVSATGCMVDATPSQSFEEKEQELALPGISLKTLIGGRYMGATNNGGSTIIATATAAQAWEKFTLDDLNGGSLTSGDAVTLRTGSGNYFKAQNGGSSSLNSEARTPLGWETFSLVKANGSGVINNGDTVALRAVNGSYVRAQNGGGSAVDVMGTSIQGWETFVIEGLPNAQGGYSLAWSDEFNGNSIDESKWAYEVQRPGWVNNELQNYTYRRAENARVENGNLVIEARRDWYEGREYSSARLKTQGKASWTYGKIEARIQVPGGWGTWPAFWMMPNDFSRGWPACGEIDILEHVGYEPNVVHATTHSRLYNWQNNGEQRTSTTSVPGATSSFHVYAAEWFPDRIDFYVDGRKYYTSSNDWTGDDAWPFKKNFFIILNLAVGGDWGGARGVDPNIWPQRMLVDYVRVYKPLGQ